MNNIKNTEDFSEGIRQDGHTIIVDLNKCIAAGPCAIAAPGVFEIRDDGKAIIINPDGDDLEKVLEAARCCPILAISIKNKAGKQIYP